MNLHRYTYSTAYIWDRGGRPVNEDSIAITDLYSDSDRMLLAVVADGIGGLKRGDYASSYVTYRLKSSFEDMSRRAGPVSHDRMLRNLKKTLCSCHRYLSSLVSDGGEGLGTTVTLLLLTGREGSVIRVGDSHLYHIRHDPVLIGRDHTDGYGRLTRCIGHGSYHRVAHQRLRVKRGDIILLCSDGFYKRGESKLTSFKNIPAKDHQSITDRLTSTLNDIRSYVTDMGEKDNISAIAIHIGK